jgi:prefoldin subunit 5
MEEEKIMGLNDVRVIVEVLVIFGSAIFAIAKISTATAVLSNTINTLSGTVEKLELTISKVDKKQDDHEKRLITLEVKTGKHA